MLSRPQGQKWRYGRLPPVENAVANPPDVTRSDKLICNRVKSCFGIIGPRIFEDFLTVIIRITKQFLIFRESHSDGTNGNNVCDVQWLWHKV